MWLFVFYEIFLAIEGDRPDLKTATMEEKTPKLTDAEIVKSNVEGGLIGYIYVVTHIPDCHIDTIRFK